MALIIETTVGANNQVTIPTNQLDDVTYFASDASNNFFPVAKKEVSGTNTIFHLTTESRNQTINPGKRLTLYRSFKLNEKSVYDYSELDKWVEEIQCKAKLREIYSVDNRSSIPFTPDNNEILLANDIKNNNNILILPYSADEFASNYINLESITRNELLHYCTTQSSLQGGTGFHFILTPPSVYAICFSNILLSTKIEYNNFDLFIKNNNNYVARDEIKYCGFDNVVFQANNNFDIGKYYYQFPGQNMEVAHNPLGSFLARPIKGEFIRFQLWTKEPISLTPEIAGLSGMTKGTTFNAQRANSFVSIDGEDYYAYTYTSTFRISLAKPIKIVWHQVQ